MGTGRSKKEMEFELRRLLSVLMSGSREEFKAAKKEITKLLHLGSDRFGSAAHVALDFLPKFEEIKTDINKEAFISGLSLFFLVLADDNFEILKNFTLKVIQHPHGHIREAMRKTAEWLFISLSSRADIFVYPEGKELTDEQQVVQAKGREQYVQYVAEIEALIAEYDYEDEDVEFVDDMKPSIHKSLQQLWGRLTDSRVYQKIMESTRPVPYAIFMKRKEIEQELEQRIRQSRSECTVEDIKDIIYHEDGQDSLTEIIAMFDRGGDASEQENILQLVNDAWNYFPHKIIDGLSPAEVDNEGSHHFG